MLFAEQVFFMVQSVSTFDTNVIHAVFDVNENVAVAQYFAALYEYIGS